VRKQFKFLSPKAEALEIECRVDLDWGMVEPDEKKIGIELAFNLLAPDETDRYFALGKRKSP
jgi:hypothetical protein